MSVFAAVSACSDYSQSSDPIPSIPKILTDHLQPQAAGKLAQLFEELYKNPQRPVANGELGMLLHVHGQLAPAIDCYLRAQYYDSAAYSWPYYLGYAYQRSGQLRASILAFERAVEMKPGHVPASMKLGWVLFEHNELERAAAVFERAFHDDPDIFESRYALGRVRLAQHRLDDAIELFQETLSQIGSSADLHYALGSAYMSAEKIALAREQFELFETFRDKPIKGNSPLPGEVLALLLSANESHDRLSVSAVADDASLKAAITGFESQVSENAYDASAHANLMVLYARQGDFKKAKEHYDNALTHLNDDAAFNFAAGNVFLLEKDYARASDSFLRVVQIDPSSSDAYHQLALAHDYAGEGSRAVQYYRNALAILPDRSTTRALLGRRLALNGDAEAALDEYSTTQEREIPAWVYYARACIAMSQGDSSSTSGLLRQSITSAEASGDEELVVAATIALQDSDAGD